MSVIYVNSRGKTKESAIAEVCIAIDMFLKIEKKRKNRKTKKKKKRKKK